MYIHIYECPLCVKRRLGSLSSAFPLEWGVNGEMICAPRVFLPCVNVLQVTFYNLKNQKGVSHHRKNTCKYCLLAVMWGLAIHRRWEHLWTQPLWTMDFQCLKILNNNQHTMSSGENTHRGAVSCSKNSHLKRRPVGAGRVN